MSKTNIIHIGGVQIPLLDYAVSCNAILGIRDSGKTVTAKGVAEQLLDHDIPIVVFDAVGKWCWMKVPGPGARGRGYKVVVAGGRAPDLALNPHSVGEIVRSAVKERIPLIIDLYDPNLSKADWRKIVQQSIRIIHYEAVGVAHVFLEEAAEYIPQKVIDTNVYAEVEKLARMGGNASVGLTVINQRSQEVNKAVLDLAHNLVLGCQIGNRAIDAVEKWIDRLSPDTAKALTTSLPHLKSGEAWVWTRTNPDDPRREQMQMCRSLHPDRRTPEIALASAKAVDPDTFVKRLQIAIPKIIEEIKANDPKELQKKIRDLEKQVAGKSPTQVETIKTVDKFVLKDGQLTRAEKILASVGTLTEKLSTVANEIKASLEKVTTNGHTPAAPRPIQSPPTQRATAPRPAPARSEGSDLNGPEQRIVDAIAWLESLGIGSPNQTAVAFLAGYTYGGGAFNNPRGSLRTKGLVEYVGSNQIRLTADGQARANYPAETLSAEELQRRVLERLPTPEQRILNVLLAVYPNSIAKDELATRASYAPGAGAFNNPCGRLRSLGLIDYPQAGHAVALPLLFLEG